MGLEGRTAVVTGGTRGLGRATVEALRERGARVAVLGLDGPGLNRLRDETRNGAESICVLACDVADPAAVADAATQVGTLLGPPEILVNNAAVVGPPRFLEDADPDRWGRTVDVNLTGPFLCVRAFLPGMLQRGRGKVVNITSGLGEMPFPRFCAYAVTKAGISQLTRSLAEEFRGDSVHVNAVDPGVMDTSMQAEIRALGPEILGRDLYRDFVGFRERGELRDPAEVADLVAWLCSPESDGVTGEIGTLSAFARLGWREQGGA